MYVFLVLSPNMLNITIYSQYTLDTYNIDVTRVKSSNTFKSTGPRVTLKSIRKTLEVTLWIDSKFNIVRAVY